jgi:hypothetical protein
MKAGAPPPGALNAAAAGMNQAQLARMHAMMAHRNLGGLPMPVYRGGGAGRGNAAQHAAAQAAAAAALAAAAQGGAAAGRAAYAGHIANANAAAAALAAAGGGGGAGAGAGGAQQQGALPGMPAGLAQFMQRFFPA